jgi:hypothetical protein
MQKPSKQEVAEYIAHCQALRARIRKAIETLPPAPR